MSYKNSPHPELENMDVNFLKKFKTDESSTFLFETEKIIDMYVGKNVFSFETTDRIVK